MVEFGEFWRKMMCACVFFQNVIQLMADFGARWFGYVWIPGIPFSTGLLQSGYPITESKNHQAPNQQLINHQLTKRPTGTDEESGNIVTEAFIVKPVIDALHGLASRANIKSVSGVIEALSDVRNCKEPKTWRIAERCFWLINGAVSNIMPVVVVCCSKTCFFLFFVVVVVVSIRGMRYETYMSLTLNQAGSNGQESYLFLAGQGWSKTILMKTVELLTVDGRNSG